MKYIPLMAILLAFTGCKKESAAFRSYKVFADHLLNERYEQARNLADGSANEYVDHIKMLHEIVPPQTLQGAAWTVESESKVGADVHLVVLQEVIRGQTAVRGAIIKTRHHVVMTETEGRWIVSSLTYEDVQ